MGQMRCDEFAEENARLRTNISSVSSSVPKKLAAEVSADAETDVEADADADATRAAAEAAYADTCDQSLFDLEPEVQTLRSEHGALPDKNVDEHERQVISEGDANMLNPKREREGTTVSIPKKVRLDEPNSFLGPCGQRCEDDLMATQFYSDGIDFTAATQLYSDDPAPLQCDNLAATQWYDDAAADATQLYGDVGDDAMTRWLESTGCNSPHSNQKTTSFNEQKSTRENSGTSGSLTTAFSSPLVAISSSTRRSSAKSSGTKTTSNQIGERRQKKGVQLHGSR